MISVYIFFIDDVVIIPRSARTADGIRVTVGPMIRLPIHARADIEEAVVRSISAGNPVLPRGEQIEVPENRFSTYIPEVPRHRIHRNLRVLTVQIFSGERVTLDVSSPLGKSGELRTTKNKELSAPWSDEDVAREAVQMIWEEAGIATR